MGAEELLLFKTIALEVFAYLTYSESLMMDKSEIIGVKHWCCSFCHQEMSSIF